MDFLANMFGLGGLMGDLNPEDDYYTRTGGSPQYEGPYMPEDAPYDEEKSLGTLMGEQGERPISGHEKAGMLGMQPPPLPDPMETLAGLMQVTGQGGQVPYQNFMPQQQNPYLQGLMNY